MGGQISIQDVHKRFRRDQQRGGRTIKDHFVRLLQPNEDRSYFWALKGVSVDVRPGEVLAVIGRNGSGKSTLLRLAGGIGRPNRGRVVREGRLLSMLDLGLGFHPDLTGEENVRVSGVIYGLTRREIRQRLPDIIAFAELQGFMESPLRTYSAGMRLRLAFAVAAHCEPEILLIDEVLAVGDLAFQNKCLQRISEFQAAGCAILLVTHDINQVRRIADRVLWLHQGKPRAYGPPAQITDAYQEFMESGEASAAASGNGLGHTALGDGQSEDAQPTKVHAKEITLSRVRLLNPQQEPITELENGAGCVVALNYECHAPVEAPRFLVEINREDGQRACHLHSSGPAPLPTKGTIVIQVDRLDLSAGNYFIDVGVFEQEWTFAYDFHWHALSLTINDELESDAVLAPPCRWQFDQAPPAAQPRGRPEAPHETEGRRPEACVDESK